MAIREGDMGTTVVAKLVGFLSSERFEITNMIDEVSAYFHFVLNYGRQRNRY